MTCEELRAFENRLYAEIEDALKEVRETGREFTEREQKYFDALIAVQSLMEYSKENECSHRSANLKHSRK